MILKQIAIASLIVIDVMRSANSGQAVKLFYKSTFLQQYNSIFNTTLDSLPIQFSNTQLLVLCILLMGNLHNLTTKIVINRDSTSSAILE